MSVLDTPLHMTEYYSSATMTTRSNFRFFDFRS